MGTLETTTLNDVDLMFNSHVKSVFSITKRAIPHLKKSKGMYLNDHAKLLCARFDLEVCGMGWGVQCRLFCCLKDRLL